MKRARPYIPLEVRLAVAERQLRAFCDGLPPNRLKDYDLAIGTGTLRQRLDRALSWLFSYKMPYQLDHDPALILRPYNEHTRKYTPDANDPEYLVYRSVPNHRQKTMGRKPGAERTVTTKGSDVWLKRKFAKLERRTKTSRRPKRKIPSRPFAKAIA